MSKISTKTKTVAGGLFGAILLLCVAGGYYSTKVPTDYSMEQFVPHKHTLMQNDLLTKKVFHVSDISPHILLLSLKSGEKARWYDPNHLEKLQILNGEIEAVTGVKSVVSLGNIQSAFENGKDLAVANLNDLRKQGFNVASILKDPLYTPNLISKDGLHTAIFITPGELSQAQHRVLMRKLQSLARKEFPQAHTQIGGPAAIRTQFIDLLSHEILIFILLSLLCAIIVVKVMFHGYSVLGQMLVILVASNLLSLGLMGFFHLGFNVLSSTLPIIVTITSLGIASHTLVRMGEFAHLQSFERWQKLKLLMRELVQPHLLTAGTTTVGFATLMTSKVPLISQYGLVVSMGVIVAAATTLLLIPCIYLFVRWPAPRAFLGSARGFSYFLVRHARVLVPGIAIFVLLFGVVGSRLSWTAKLFDDLPSGHSVSKTTELISRKLGGVASVDLVVGGGKDAGLWKDPVNIARLKYLSQTWRRSGRVGSVLSLADFLATGKSKELLPKKKESVAELEFLYAMSGESPLKQFLSADEKWTRMAVRLPDMPSDQNHKLIAGLIGDLQKQFPRLEVKSGGIGNVVPVINEELSKELMWGFFESLFWIVLILALNFRSLRWALVAVVPNLVPPILLLGFLALFHVPIKPGIAIIFSISLGLAFCNTVYVLERLKHMLAGGIKRRTLPIYELMRDETMPCLVSSLSLLGGFSIFLFSVFPMNKLFGLFMLISIAAGLLGDLVWLPVLLKRFPALLLEGDEGMSFAKFKNALQVGVLALLGMMAFHSAYAADDVKSIMKAVEAKGQPPCERVDLKMLITDADGGKKERELSILRKNVSGDNRALVRLSKPADLKGLGLLTMVKNKQEEQYLYLPSEKKSRRILGSNKKGKFLDSEISFEDLSISTYKSFENKVVKDDGKTVVVESKAKPGSESSYGKVITWISKPEYLVQRVDYFDKAGKPLKRTQFKGYQKVGGNFWRAKNMLVENLQTKNKTEMIVQRISLKEIPDDDISLSALED